MINFKYLILNYSLRIKNLKFKIISLILLVTALIVVVDVVYVAYQNVSHWNSLTVEYQFKSGARIFGLYPSDRVSKLYSQQSTVNSQQKFQEMVASPVYLDVRYWQKFTKAKVELWYEKDPEVDFQIGYKVGRDFQWKLFDVQGELLTFSAIARKVSRAEFDISLSGEYVPRRNVHRWIFSSDNVQDLEKTIRIYGIKFTFTR